MPILHQREPLCGLTLDAGLAEELGITKPLHCGLEQDHGPAPDHAAAIFVGKIGAQVAWRTDSMIPLAVRPPYCGKVLPAELAAELGMRARVTCNFAPDHRGADTVVFKQITLAWWPKRGADE